MYQRVGLVYIQITKIAADGENKKMDVDQKCGKYGSILDKMGCNRRQVKSKPTIYHNSTKICNV